MCPSAEAVEKVRVLLSEQPGVGSDARQVLQSADDMTIVGQAHSGRQTISLAAHLKPDVLVIEDCGEGVDALLTVESLKAGGEAPPVLIYTTWDDDEHVFTLLSAGVSGYLLKDIGAAEFLSAVRTVSSGQCVLHPDIARRVMARFAEQAGRPLADRPSSLSKRETEVFDLLASGLGDRDIAQRLGVSTRTVQVHVQHIFKRLGVRSRMDAISFALRHGWLSAQRITLAHGHRDGAAPPSGVPREGAGAMPLG